MTKAWRDSVLDAVYRCAIASDDGLVERDDLLQQELDTIVNETSSIGRTPAQTLSRVLQELRDEGAIEFVREGTYRLVYEPIDVEAKEFSDTEVDSLIRRKLLRLGRVETSDQVALSRRRRGQDRVRTLALDNYGNQCALCDISDTSLLIASHIVRWADSEIARGDLSNVLCLCRFHDILFELGYWSLTNSYEVVRKSAVIGWPVSMLLPDAIAFREPCAFEPDIKYLTEHRGRHAFNQV